MTDVTIYGPSASTYLRTARIACEEKGVAHALEPIEFGAESHRALHPFLRVPAFRHGDFALYETAAIARYVDEAFDGPPLQPADARGRARMDQWISAVSDYFDAVVTRGILLPRLIGRAPDGQSVDDTVAAAVPRANEYLAIADAALGETPFLAGAELSLADFFLGPIVYWLRAVPEGDELLAERPALARGYAALAGRPSFAATDPRPAGDATT